MKDKKKLFMIVSIYILIITVIASSVTYAYYVWDTDESEETRIVTAIGVLKVIYDSGTDIIGANLKPTATKEEGIVKNITVKTNKESDQDIFFNLYLDVILDEGLKDVSFRYAVYKEGQTEVLSEGNFSQSYLDSNLVTCETNSTNHIVLISDETVTTTTQEYKLYIWIDGNMSNPQSMQGQNFNFKLHADGESNKESSKILSEYITNLYLKNKDTEPVVNNDISYGYASIYDRDSDTDPENITSGGLMNDRLGTMSTEMDAGNVRYYGKNPNNYIYFNCSDYSNQTSSTCEVWRIIGVFDGKVKIMRNTTLGNMAWDQDKNQDSSLTTHDNNWTTSTLQKFLNEKYYNRGTTTTHIYYSGSDGTTETSINLKSKGIKNDVTRGLISKSTWYLRGCDGNQIYANQMYEYERKKGSVFVTGQSKTVSRNIGIPYVSDYGYAADLSSCTEVLGKYNNTNCTSTNWMKSTFKSTKVWFIATYPDFPGYVWYMTSTGQVIDRYNSYYAHSVLPVLHLTPELSIASGDGTQDNPYQLMVS